MGNILVIRGGAIGDFVLTLPVLRALRTFLPGNRLEVLGYPHIARLALAGGLVDEVTPIESRPMAGFFARGGRLDPALMEYFQRFDLIISYLFDPDRIFQDNVQRCTRAQYLAGPHRPDESGSLHAAATFLKPLERLAIFEADDVPALAVDAPSGPAAGRGPRLTPEWDWFAVHPGSGSDRKNWPEEHWQVLLPSLCTQTDFSLLLVGGEAEGERLERLAALLPPGRFQVARNLPLVHLAGLLGSCAGFLGHDSGISHLAAALGLPTLLLWGDTKAQIWRPPSPRCELLHHPSGLAALSPPEVLGEILRRWPAARGQVQVE